MGTLLTLYAYDNLRGDGFAVRFARLNMMSTHMTLVWVLCWAMEASFALAYYQRVKLPFIVAFVVAYATLLAKVYGYA